MSVTRSHRTRLLVIAAVAAATSALAAPAPNPAPRPRAAGVASAPVEWAESVPLETALGNPRMRRAADVWLELVRGATTRIDLEQFYLSTWPNEPLEPILAALVEAARRGVRVRLLLDARMHRTYPLPADSLGRVPGFSVRTIDFGKIAGGIQHSKYFIVDGASVFVGSQNFDWRALEHIHELGVRLRDERVAARFQQVFDMDWAAAGMQAAGGDSRGLPAPPAPDAGFSARPIRIVQSPGDTVWVWPSWNPAAFSPDSMLWDRDVVVRDIDRAHREIVAQSLDYAIEDRGVRDAALDQALRRAAARGVRVKLLISDWQAGRDGMRALDSLADVPGVEVRLSSVPEWSGGYIPFGRVEHCKYMVVDTLATWVGTSNWTPSYFHTSRNLAVTLENRPLALEARTTFETSWKANETRPVHRGVVYPARAHGDKAPEGVRTVGK